MKHLKLYEEYSEQNTFLKDEDEIRSWLSDNIVDYGKLENDITIKDGVVNVYTIGDYIGGGSNYSVDINPNINLERLPVKFGNVYTGFKCIDNDLKTLEGSPDLCVAFDVSNNYFTSLKGIPKHILGELDLSDNPIVYFDYKPETVNGAPFQEALSSKSILLVDTFLMERYYALNNYTISNKTRNGGIEASVKKFLAIVNDILSIDRSKIKPYSRLKNPDKIDFIAVSKLIEKYLPEHWEEMNKPEYSDLVGWMERSTKAQQHKDIFDF